MLRSSCKIGHRGILSPLPPFFRWSFKICVPILALSRPNMMNSSLVVLSIGQFMTYVMFPECDQTSLRGTKDPFKFAPLLTCGVTAMLVVHSCQPVSAWHGCEFPSKPENFFPLMIESCSLHVKMML